MNEVLRDEYVEDCQRGVDRWNKTIEDEGVSFELTLPSASSTARSACGRSIASRLPAL